MAAEQRHLPEQEQSIKAREHELYHKPLPAGAAKPTKSFPLYLRETPAQPLSATTKIMLWMAAMIVALLFFAAIWRVMQRHGAKPRAQTAARRVKTVHVPTGYIAGDGLWAQRLVGRAVATTGSDAIDVHSVRREVIVEAPVSHRQAPAFAQYFGRGFAG